MEKVFKGFCVAMASIILLCAVIMPSAVKKMEDNEFLSDPFGCEEIIESIQNYEINLTSIIYVKNKDGEWEEYQRIHGEENRIWVSIDKIPDKLIDAFIAIEDERFYTHTGVDWKRTVKAVANKTLDLGEGVFGGSTITQQLIKNITKDDKRTSDRKMREIVRALTIERKLNKEQILEAYLNTISLGNGICGVQVASNYYFNKDVSELNLLECASLAAITKNPSAYNPIRDPEANKTRRNTVLKKMYELDMIVEEDYKNCVDVELMLDNSQKKDFEIPVNSYFVDALIDNIINDLSEKYSCSTSLASTMLYNGGFKIYSTVDMEVQGIMEDVYNDINTYFPQKAKLKSEKGKTVQSAMTITDYEGHIIGIVGGVGKKTENRGLNRAVDSPRQPGSTMKPLGAYTPALENGTIAASTFMVDSPLDNYYSSGKKGPKEWYGYYAGRMNIQSALERSANTIPCKIIKEMGLDISFDFLTDKLHLKHLTEKDKNLSSLALGGCVRGITTTESAAAYAIFGNQGKYFKPVTYYKIERPNGEIVLQCDTKGDQIIKPATATIMNTMLQKVVYGSRGTGRKIASYNKMKAYAKTGTSSECNDLWMVAGTPYYVGCVWYGFDIQEEIYNTNSAANVWKAVMTEVHKNLEFKEFELSEDYETKKYCSYSGNLAGEKCYGKKDGMFIPGVEVKVCDGKHYSTETSSTASDTSSTESGNNSSSNTSNNVSSVTSSGDNTVSDGSTDSSSDGGGSGENTPSDIPGGNENQSSSDPQSPGDSGETPPTEPGGSSETSHQ